jgi:exodeoxyribonuclease VII small subunit
MTAPLSGDLPDPNNLSYEEAARELEEIIQSLESPQASLEESLALYERGQLLAQRCTALLDQAELRLRVLGNEQDI